MSEKNNKNPAYCQKWIESERNWGQRPDGVSLHKTRDDVMAFIAEYWDGMPSGRAPEVYSKPESPF